MRAPVGKSVFLIFLIILCSFCNMFFDTGKAKQLFSRDKKKFEQAMVYCIKHRTRAEDYLIALYPSESTTNRNLILRALGQFGGEKSAVFVCKLIAETPTTDEGDLNFRLNVLGHNLDDYDWGSFYINPDKTDFSRTVIVSQKNKQFFADTISALIVRLKRSKVKSGLSRTNLKRALNLRSYISSLKTHE